MIIFDGIINKKNICQIVFKNENGDKETITVPKNIGDIFELRLSRLSSYSGSVVERGNDEASE